MFNLSIKYEPDDESNRIPAVSGGRSIEGLAHSVRVILHFAATGHIQHREPFHDDIDLYLSTPRPGSFVVDLLSNVDWKNAIVGGVLVGVPASLASSAIYDLIKHTFKSISGSESQPTTEPVKTIEKDKSGTFDALMEAVTPGIKRAHSPIGGGVTIINITGDHNKVVFDPSTKEFINSSIKTPGQQKASVSVGSLNANRRTGRAYFESEQRLIPFRVSRMADVATLAVLADSLSRYSNSFDFTSSTIEIRYEGTLAPDGRLKSILIFGAAPYFG